MKPKEIAALRNRWTPEETKRINALLVKGIKRDDPITTFVEQDGICYHDFRGLTITVSPRQVLLERADFSYGTHKGVGQFAYCTLQECRFIKFGEHYNLGLVLTKCDCSASKLSGTVFRGTYEDCNFDKCDLRNAWGGDRFIRCSFRGADLKSASFIDATFDHCDWAGAKFVHGSLGGAVFIGTRPAAETLGNTILVKTVFKRDSTSPAEQVESSTDSTSQLRRKLAAGMPLERALAELRAAGFGNIDCVMSVSALHHCSFDEAVRTVKALPAWSDVETGIVDECREFKED